MDQDNETQKFDSSETSPEDYSLDDYENMDKGAIIKRLREKEEELDLIYTKFLEKEEDSLAKIAIAQKDEGLTEKLQEEKKKLQEEKENFKDLYERAHAEMKNMKSRLERDAQEKITYSNEGIIKNLLPELDNLYRALDHVQENEETSGLIEGVRLTLDGLMSVLKKEGVEEIKAIGEPFDPNFHQAVSAQESKEFDSGYVIQELQKGYTLKGRLLRPSAVIVSK